MRRAALLAAVLALAGCGGDKGTQSTTVETVKLPTTTTSGDPGKDAIGAFVAAAKTGNVDALWGMLSVQSKQRLGPSLGEFKSGAGNEIADELGGFGDYKIVVSERITPELGVVAIDNKKEVYAVPLRLEDTKWKLELGGPVKVRPIGPDPGAVEPVVAQIAAAVVGPGGAGTAVMYVDGLTENPQVRGTPSNATLFQNFDPKFDPGRHTVVVFATDGREAGATGWAFTVKKKS